MENQFHMLDITRSSFKLFHALIFHLQPLGSPTF